MKLTKNAGRDKYGCSGYDVGFDAYSQFSWADDSWGKQFIILWDNNSFSVHVSKKEICYSAKNILIQSKRFRNKTISSVFR